MGLMVKYFFLVFQVCAIASTLVLEGSSGQTISPSASFSGVPPIVEGQITSNSPGPTSQPNDPPHVESPNEPPPNAGVAGPITSIPEGSPPSPPVVPPTIPVSMPPIPQPEKGLDSKSPVSPPTMPVQLAPPPKDILENPPPVAQVPTSVSQAPPSVPQAPPIVFPGPVASPPNKLPMASPPTNRTFPVPPPNLPLPAELPPSTLPSSPPTLPPPPPNLPVPVELPPSTLPSSPPTLPPPPPNLPVPSASPPSTLPTNSPPSPPTLPIPPPNVPAPMASPPSTLPRSSPPTPPTSTIPPPNLPAPMASPPSTLPRGSPPAPPTSTIPPPNLPAPMASPPSTLPRGSPPAPPTSTIPPPNLPAPMASPPSTLPRSSPPTPLTSTIPPPNLPAPMASPPSTLPRSSPPAPPTSTIPPPNLPAPMASPASTLPRSSPPTPPISTIPPPNSPVPVASPPHAPQRDLPPPPPTVVESPSSLPGPVALPPRNSPENLPPIQHNSSMPPPNLPVSPVSTPIPSINKGGNGFPVSSPPNRTTNSAPPPRSPIKAPIVNHAPPPHSGYESPPTKSHPPPSLPPVYPPPPPGLVSRPTHHRPPPPPGPASNPRHHTPPPPSLDSAVPPVENSVSPSISPFTTPPPVETTVPVLSPKVSPSRSPPSILKPIQALPPPPPNEDCLSIVCMDPLTNTPPGTPCRCVLPMQVELRLSISLYTFFPLVSELAFEMASGLFLRSSQVRIMGANEDNQDQEKTIVMINLVPLGEKFDNYTAYVAAQRLWMKQVPIKSSLFGDYEVLFVKYPGLPPSPPLPSSGYNGEPYGRGNNGRDVKPLGVDVSKQRHSNKLNSGLIAIIAFSVVVAVVLVGVVVWVLVLKDRTGARSGSNPPATIPPVTKSSGVGASTNGSGPESASLSFRSSIAYTGSAKTFSLSEMEKATDNFSELGVLGEGGFGRVYSGVLEEGTKVAVKVLKRDDQQGGREFLAEVEMLSRLHHRNVVRLIGICTEEKNRCLVYELIPNGSVESHLHGIDKETSPLDWGARLKIALGAARGLAYLHEDSSPRVIHRDFKSSNILLEHDFTPKVSDFGLARTALDEENRHISTRVMGTFGYVAPEYAMTGHLLVKSDVYSYGVVLLELLTGRKPVDMSMPSGQENLVAWARPLLPSHEGLNLLIDPSLSPEVPFDSIAKVAAIASMCVQPEVSHRPFMGEVVQALKLVCNECEETQDLGSRTCSQEDLVSMEFDPRAGPDSGLSRSNYPSYESPLDVESGFSGLRVDVDSYRISSSSGPMRPRRRSPIWERMKRFSSGNMSDYGEVLRLLSRSR